MNLRLQKAVPDMKKFSVTLLLEVEEPNSLLSSHMDSHTEDVFDFVQDVFYDNEDVNVKNLLVKERFNAWLETVQWMGRR